MEAATPGENQTTGGLGSIEYFPTIAFAMSVVFTHTGLPNTRGFVEGRPVDF